MQLRRMTTLVAPLLGVLVLSLAAGSASAQDMKVRSPHERDYVTRVAKLRTSAVLVDPETLWVGHVTGTLGYGPNHIGTGSRLIFGGTNGGGSTSKPASSYEGVWSFDNFQVGETDSLQGWWPIQGCFASVGPSDKDDCDRPWFALDYGNQGNYAIGSPAAPKKTFGVVGYWHADAGNLAITATTPGTNPVQPGWAPITGTRSAWCGLRSHGDLSVQAQDVTGTGNFINDDLASFQGNNSGRQTNPVTPVTAGVIGATDHNFPGYGSQWDQMMYRDVTLGANLASGTLNIAFNYSTNMSDGFNGAHSSQTGYFYNDPLLVAGCTDGNFMSATGAGGIADSFMVYIGAPVEPVAGAANDFVASDGVAREIFDPQRRWFSEVLKLGASRLQILSAHGVNANTAFSVSVPLAAANAILDADGGAGNGGRIRICLRVKTNRGFDDENFGNGGFGSGGAGAAIVDDVLISSSAGTLLSNGFEGTNGDVNNAVATAATAAWKSTGKPPGTWTHIHNSASLTAAFTDPCGDIFAINRLCNMGGNVLVPGNHDINDKPGGGFGSNTQDQQKLVVSPTINLKATDATTANAMGINGAVASRKGIFLFADQLWNVYDYNVSTGNGWRIGWQSYPAIQSNGVKCWGEMRKDITFNATGGILGCFDTFESSGYDEQLIATTNAGGVPDSVRVYIEAMARCYTLPLLALNCSPDAGPHAGGYFDNLSIGLFALVPASLAMAFGSNLQDCFPYNSGNLSLTAFGTAYDTLGARIQTGNNIAPNSKNDLTGSGAREVIAGDTAIVVASGNNVRVDMVFRIFPGVGNYVTIGNRASGVARLPYTVPRVLALPTDGTLAGDHTNRFFGSYMANTGAFGTDGDGTATAHPHRDTDGAGGFAAGSAWDVNSWNSARMDTLEQNFFPDNGVQSNIGTTTNGGIVLGNYMSTYHESDPRYTVLGISKNRCVLKQPDLANPVKIKAGSINCRGGAGKPGGDNFTKLPNYFYTGVQFVATGLPLEEIAGEPHSLDGAVPTLHEGTTYEYTKIIPDGLFTPGTEIQYFFRKSVIGDPITTFGMTPDTNNVIPNDSPFSSFDGHRWFEASVLPDRWKAFEGSGMACMLVVDEGDRRGDEFIWVSVADSIGLTTTAKRGAHNGWHAHPTQDPAQSINAAINAALPSAGVPELARRDNGGQAGSLWDLYETVAGESNFPAGRLGSRAAAHNTAAGSYTEGHQTTNGPDSKMLNNYKTLVWLGSDVGEDGIGPVPNQTDDDIGLLNSFMTSAVGEQVAPRCLVMMGYDIGTALWAPGTGTVQRNFMVNVLRADLRNTDYRPYSANTLNTSFVDVKTPVSLAATTQYGIGNQCFIDNDVFNVETPAPAGTVGALYQNVVGPAGQLGPYVAAVYTPVVGSHNARTLLAGWTLGLFGGGFGQTCTGCGSQGADLFLNLGARKFLFEVLTSAFGGLGCQPSGTPVGVGDNPGSGGGSAYVNFMNLRSSNPMHSGETRLAFGLARTEKVELRVYDVTGRVVKTVANRVFAGGQEHVVVWNGTDQAGNHVKSGVYFYQLRTPTWTSQKKLAVLAN